MLKGIFLTRKVDFVRHPLPIGDPQIGPTFQTHPAESRFELMDRLNATGINGMEPQTTFVEDRPWHTLDVDATERLFNTSPKGLAPEEAHRRLAQHGPNEIEKEKRTRWWKSLLHQFADPLIYILLVAAILTLVLQEYTDTGVILTVVFINAIIGFTQERRAEQAMTALADLSAPRCEVIRTSGEEDIASRDLVPGDVVVLTSGVRVPADIRLFRVQDLQVDESALTGESLSAHKSPQMLELDSLVPGDQLNMVFSGTVVTRGRGWGYVVRTGTQTELGRIATAIREVGETATPLQETMIRFGKQIALAVIRAATGRRAGRWIHSCGPPGDARSGTYGGDGCRPGRSHRRHSRHHAHR